VADDLAATPAEQRGNDGRNVAERLAFVHDLIERCNVPATTPQAEEAAPHPT